MSPLRGWHSGLNIRRPILQKAKRRTETEVSKGSGRAQGTLGPAKMSVSKGIPASPPLDPPPAALATWHNHHPSLAASCLSDLYPWPVPSICFGKAEVLSGSLLRPLVPRQCLAQWVLSEQQVMTK